MNKIGTFSSCYFALFVIFDGAFLHYEVSADEVLILDGGHHTNSIRLSLEGRSSPHISGPNRQGLSSTDHSHADNVVDTNSTIHPSLVGSAFWSRVVNRAPSKNLAGSPLEDGKIDIS